MFDHVLLLDIRLLGERGTKDEQIGYACLGDKR